MENKYQKALEKITLIIQPNCLDIAIKPLETLQELIDNFKFLQDYSHQLEEELFGKKD